MPENVAVLGSGSWGTALAILLCQNGHDVTLWSYTTHEFEQMRDTRENKDFLPGVTIPDRIRLTTDRESAVTGAMVVVTAIPSAFLRKTLETFVPYITKRQLIVNVSKGFDELKKIRLSEVIQELLPENKVAVLSGPSHAEEVSRGIPSAVIASSADSRAAEAVQDLFMNDAFRVYTNADIIGVELGGAVKNVIALAAGIADGLGFGDNTKAALMTRGMAEMARLGVAMGADPFTFSGLSGVGDLIVTCTSMHSRNRRAGILIGQGKTLKEALHEVRMVVEGVTALKSVCELAEKYRVEMPISAEMHLALYEGKDIKQAVIDLMTRDKTTEKPPLFSF